MTFLLKYVNVTQLDHVYPYTDIIMILIKWNILFEEVGSKEEEKEKYCIYSEWSDLL